MSHRSAKRRPAGHGPEDGRDKPDFAADWFAPSDRRRPNRQAPAAPDAADGAAKLSERLDASTTAGLERMKQRLLAAERPAPKRASAGAGDRAGHGRGGSAPSPRAGRDASVEDDGRSFQELFDPQEEDTASFEELLNESKLDWQKFKE
ncbi:MAG: hypothetical protein K6T78_01225 [Alicyclobacillus sp.]|nr:hypothetical protein [Alicyclobacillus sp.]